MVGVEDDKGGRYNRRLGITTPNEKQSPIRPYNMPQVDVLQSVMLYQSVTYKDKEDVDSTRTFFLNFSVHSFSVCDKMLIS